MRLFKPRKGESIEEATTRLVKICKKTKLVSNNKLSAFIAKPFKIAMGRMLSGSALAQFSATFPDMNVDQLPAHAAELRLRLDDDAMQVCAAERAQHSLAEDDQEDSEECHGAFTSKCFKCHKIGHLARNCSNTNSNSKGDQASEIQKLMTMFNEFKSAAEKKEETLVKELQQFRLQQASSTMNTNAPAPSRFPRYSDNQSSNMRCHRCHKVGHFIRDCRAEYCEYHKSMGHPTSNCRDAAKYGSRGRQGSS